MQGPSKTGVRAICQGLHRTLWRRISCPSILSPPSRLVYGYDDKGLRPNMSQTRSHGADQRKTDSDTVDDVREDMVYWGYSRIWWFWMILGCLDAVEARKLEHDRQLMAKQQKEMQHKHSKSIWVVVKMMVPFWVLSIIRHLVFRGPKKRPWF